MSQTVQPEPVSYHWIMTVQINDGRQATTDGRIDVLPGAHTHDGTYGAALKSVKEWVGTDKVAVLFFSLAPNAL